MRIIIYISLLLCLFLGATSFSNETQTIIYPKPICRLIVNDICDSSDQACSVQLLGIDCNILYDESYVQDTLYLSIKETDSNRYRNASIVNSPNNAFFIRIDLANDTASLMINLYDGRLEIQQIENPGFVRIEPLLDMNPNIMPVKIRLRKNNRNIFTINNLIRHLKKNIDSDFDLVFPREGTYRGLCPFWLVKSGRQKWFETEEGVMLFLKPDIPLDENSANNLEDVIDSLILIYSDM